MITPGAAVAVPIAWCVRAPTPGAQAVKLTAAVLLQQCALVSFPPAGVYWDYCLDRDLPV